MQFTAIIQDTYGDKIIFGPFRKFEDAKQWTDLNIFESEKLIEIVLIHPAVKDRRHRK